MEIKGSTAGLARRVGRLGLAAVVAGLTLGVMLAAMQDVRAAPDGEVIIDCDSAAGWSAVNAASVTTDTSDLKEGTASISVTGDGGAPSWGCYEPSSGWDLSDDTAITFWFSDTAPTTRTLLLRAGSEDYDRWYPFTSTTGWKSQAIDISAHPPSTTHVSDSPDTTKMFDWTDVVLICFGDPDEDATFRVDYIFIGDGNPIDLQISKTSEPGSVAPGGLLTYTLTVTNSGVATATGVVVMDTLPLSTTLHEPLTWHQIGSTRTYSRSLSDLGPDDTEVLTLAVKIVTDTVAAGWDLITNTAGVEDDGSHHGDDNVMDNIVIHEADLDAAPQLEISKTDPFTTVVPGDTITYTITITNTGNQDATGVVVTDTLPASTTYQDGTSGWILVDATRGYTYPVGSLLAGYTKTLTLTVRLTDTVPATFEEITNEVKVADDGTNGFTGTVSDTDVDDVEAAPKLEISKTDDDDGVEPGDTITYTIAISNTGNQDATGVVVTDTLPLSTTYEGGTAGWAQVGSTRAYTSGVGALGAGETETLTLTLRLTDTLLAGVEAITNAVSAVTDGTNGFTGTVRVTDVDDVAAAPQLAISKTDPVTTVVPGDTITYTIAISNTGNQDATGVVVTDTLPLSTTYEGGTAGWVQVGSTRAYTSAVGALGAGATETLILTARLTDTVLAGVEAITNAVSVVTDGKNGFTGTVSTTEVDAVVAAADLAIRKTDGVTSVLPGQTLTYTLTITNTGNQGATGVVVTDTLPAAAHTDFITASDGGIESGGIVTWPIFNLAGGDRATRTVTLEVKNPAQWPAGVEAITNTVFVLTDGTNGFTGTLGATDVDAIDVAPDLLISKSDYSVWAMPGQGLVYELAYLNKGTQVAAGVVITERLPNYTAFNAAGSTVGWQSAGATGVYTLSLGTVPVGVGGAVNFAVTVSDTLPAGVDAITNTVEIGDDGTGGADETPGDNSDQDVDVLVAAPDLVITKDDGLDLVTPGQLVMYTLTISNVGEQGATGVTVSDTLPEDTTLVGASHSGGLSGGVYTWSSFDLGAGQVVTRSLTVELSDTIPADVEAITNTASVADDGANGDDVTPEDNTTDDVDEVEAVPIVALVKTDGRLQVKPGDTLTYTITAKNVGRQDAAALVITDTLPEHITFIAASPGYVKPDGVVVWTGIALPVGGQIERQVTVRVDESLPPSVTTITNTAEVAGPEGVFDSDTDVDSLVQVPDLVLIKDDGEDSVVAKQIVTYTLTITNAGTGIATDIVVTDTLPEETAFVAASDGGGETSLDSGVVTWPTFALAPGDAVSRTVTVQVAAAVPAGLETITNTASVADDGTHGPDLDPTDNSAEDVDILDAEPLLSIAKSDGRNAVQPGDILTYTLVITNVGTQGAAGVVVTDTLPENTGFLAASGGVSPVGGEVTWPTFALDAGQVVTQMVSVQLDETLPSSVSAITNTAVAVGDGGLSASAHDVDTVVAAPDLQVVKTDGRAWARPGEVLTYTLLVANLGTQGATGVVVSDALPANTAFLAASNGGDETSPSSGVVTWPDFPLGVGAVVTRTVTVEVAETWPVGATGVLTNTAYVSDDGVNGDDPELGNNSDIDITSVWLYQLYMPLISNRETN